MNLTGVPGVYDNNIFSSAENQHINIIYAQWLDEEMNYMRDDERLKDLKESILSTIRNNRSKEVIKAWHIGNPVWHTLKSKYNKPQLIYQREAYIQWLSDLIHEIKSIDQSRPVSIELDHDPYLPEIAAFMKTSIPELDAIGINLDFTDTSMVHTINSLQNLPLSVFINKLPGLKPSSYDSLNTGWLLHSWQDDVFKNYVSLTGLLDHHGLRKPEYQSLEIRVGQAGNAPTFPQVEILRPAKPTYRGITLRYHALLKPGDQWELAAFDPLDFDYRWQLVKTDGFGNILAMRSESEGVAIDLTIPPAPHLYRLRLIVSKDGYSTSATIPLTTPVYSGTDLEELSREEIDYLFRENKK